MDIYDEIDNCDSCRDIDKLIRKIRHRRDTAKTAVAVTTNTARAVSSVILTKKTVSEGVKVSSSWNKYDTPEEKVNKVTPFAKWVVITILTDTAEKAIGSMLKRRISDKAEDMIYEADKARRRFHRRENQNN